MSGIEAGYPGWVALQRALREAVAGLTPEQLALRPNDDPERWPVWAIVGHLACARVFWLCDFAGEPGARTTPFTNAAWECPEEDVAHPLDAPALVAALDATWAIVERSLATWSPAMLEEVISRPEWPDRRTHPRGWVLSRVATHDAWHASEVNETLTALGLPAIDPWR
jgi:hypothetical protein